MKRFPLILVLLFTAAVAPESLHAQSSSAAPAASSPRQMALDHLRSVTALPIPEWRYLAGDSFSGSSPDLDDSAWKVLHPGDVFPGDPAWFRASITIPRDLHGYDPAGSALHLAFRTETDADLRLFVNGIEVAGLEDGSAPLLSAHAAPGQTYLIAVLKSAEQFSRHLGTADLLFLVPSSRPDPGMFREETISADEIIQAYPDDRDAREHQLDAALALIDWRALDTGDQLAFDHSLNNAENSLASLREWLKTLSVHAVGNAHIDMAWLWPWTETVDVVRRTFSTALRLMHEFPDFTFSMSSAQAYAWMEEKYPDLYREILERVREGRWEIVGGMWVEPDLNMPDGESQVRQLLIGKEYFQDHFGVDVHVGWNPDSFGYNWQLPQIYKKSGVDYFVTQKLYWNDTSQFPYKLFWWQAPDGSRVLTYFPHDYVNYMDPERIAADVAVYAPATRWPDMLYLYGVGDHGGGPTRDMLENAARYASKDAIFPRLTLGTAQSYFDALAPKAASLSLPVWQSELYLQFHRGAYTTQAAEKSDNRRSEVLLLNAEKFSSLANLFGAPYPQLEFEGAWKKVLFNQFHDVMAGSGIAAIYKDAARDHASVRQTGQETLQSSLADLGARADTRGEGSPLLVFNALSWPRTSLVEAQVSLFDSRGGEVEVRNSAGKPVLSEVMGREPGSSRFTIRFVAANVPSLGYSVFHVEAVRHAARLPSPIKATGDTIENEFYRVRVDAATGCLTSVYDKRANRQAIASIGCGNLLQAFKDTPKSWDAWNIDADFETQHWDLLTADKVALVEHSPVRAVIEVRKHFQSSTFVQDIILSAGVPRVDVAMSADWHEKHILLKVAFPVTVHNDFATYEIPYGSIQRPTTRRTPEEQAQFEVPALRWADLSDSEFGLSLLNDSKYGYDTKDNIIRLSLLRSPTWPDPHADEGMHHFIYSLYPHGHGWQEANTVERGYELNNPLIAFPEPAHTGSLPSSYSFLAVDAPNVVVTALKHADHGDALILRFYESAGHAADVHITPPPGLRHAHFVNLMEKSANAAGAGGASSDLPIKDGRLVLHTDPWEIQTVELEFAPHASPPGEKTPTN
jgi:alpha-mannosidase